MENVQNCLRLEIVKKDDQKYKKSNNLNQLSTEFKNPMKIVIVIRLNKKKS